MSVRHSIKAGVACLAAACALVLGPSAIGGASALGASPWWHLTSGARPSNIQPGYARDEVQDVTVKATEGSFILGEPVSLENFEFANFEGEPRFASFPFNASASEVQTGLEGVYGAGNVHVSGGPGDAAGANPYVISLAGQRRPVVAFNNLEGGEVTVTEVSVGRPDGEVVVDAANLGDANANSELVPIRLADKLPADLRAVSIVGAAGGKTGESAGPVECDLKILVCMFKASSLPLFDQIELRIAVIAEEGPGSGENQMNISGGGAQSASIRRTVPVGGAPAPFGVEDYKLAFEQEGGANDTQAGSHPFQVTGSLSLNQTAEAASVALAKDVNVKLPPGLIGNATAFPKCSLAQFFAAPRPTCPAQSVLGVAVSTVNEPLNLGVDTITVPIFNLEPAHGEPARFGFLPTAKLPASIPVFLDTSVRTGADYGVTVSVHNISQTVDFLNSLVTFWGVPGDPRHDSARGENCLIEARGQTPPHPCQHSEESNPAPFMSLPTSCTGQLHSSVDADSWEQVGVLSSRESPALPSLTGCNRVPFGPSISASPDSRTPSSATGLTVDIHVPQDQSRNAAGLAESTLRNTTFALPVGVTLNPAAADGLDACSLAQIGLDNGTSPSCPEASEVGTVEVHTPLLPNPLTGAAYLAAQNANPFGSLVALYLVFQDPVSGTLVKLAGDVTPDPVTGQLVTTFTDSPQLPFEDVKLSFFSGARAALATPKTCGTYASQATLAPWSGNASANVSSTFEIVAPAGVHCTNPLPFAPSLAAGSASTRAAGFTSFTATVSREDGQQDIHSLRLHMPPGLSGILANVALCGEAQANAGTCGPESMIGETTVSVGVGASPFTVQGGKVFITGPYEGSPFGLSIATPAKAGPYDLGSGPCDCVVVRAKIDVDPRTAELTITTDSTGPHQIPTILDGIPLSIRHINTTINRERFTFNPSNCQVMGVDGTITSTEGASAALGSPFQAANCATLQFAPKLNVSTPGKTSKLAGAGLTAKLVYPRAPQGTQANISKVKVDLPKQLPSRLTTLQKACIAAVFQANPANCPAASIVGHAKVLTPLLPVPLTGPAYFVSHGGEAFPSLTMVLQGYGVTVELVGATLIKHGITSTTFNTVPDVPFSQFELTLPQGRFSALAANGNLCKSKLSMPTAFYGQNGAELHGASKIAVTGCAKAKKKPNKAVRRRPKK